METHEPQNWTQSRNQKQFWLLPCGTGIKKNNLQALIVSGCFKEISQNLKTSINSSKIKAISYKTVLWFSAPSGACMPEK